MLPYRLRSPVYGKRLKQLKKAAGDDALAGGGPVQRAIEKDFVKLQATFHNVLEDSREAQGGSTKISHRHCPRGKLFAAFKKEIFEVNKLALLHSLAPHKCDREAYSQLIYASCLSLLKRAFSSATPDLVFEEASYAVFLLYCMFQTNPLPRSFDKSCLELLPMGIHSSENSKLLYRRSFALKIRVDHCHYVLLLRLRMMAAELQAECQQRCMEAHERRLAPGGEPSWSWTCSCGLSQDVVEIVERLMSQLDFCEYTGPVSLEGLAGHADYPYAPRNKLDTIRQQDIVPPLRLKVTELPEPYDDKNSSHFRNELKDVIAGYCSRLHSVPLPGGDAIKGKASAAQLEDVLQILSSSKAKKSMTDKMHRLFSSLNEEEVATPSSAAEIVPQPEATERLAGHTFRGEAAVGGGETSTGEQNTCPSYELVLPEDLEQSVREGVEEAVMLLSAREGGILPTDPEDTGDVGAPHSETMNSGDEMSSVGDGGISVATGQGRLALQALISSVHNHRQQVPRVARILKRPEPSAQKSRASSDEFLNIDMPLDSTGRFDDDSASDLSVQDFEDDFSMATDTVGRRALESLVSSVSPGNRATTAKRKQTAKKNSSRATKVPKMASRHQGSVGTSVGQGRAALASLLSTAKGSNLSEDASVGASVEQGRAALDSLIATAQSNKTRRKAVKQNAVSKKSLPKGSRNGKATHRSGRAHPVEDGSSTATSVGQGKTALDALLSRVRRTKKTKNASSMSTGTASVDQLLLPPHCEDGSATITSVEQGKLL